MKSKKFGVVLDGALATAVLAAAISATTWARPVEPAPQLRDCCYDVTCNGAEGSVYIRRCVYNCDLNTSHCSGTQTCANGGSVTAACVPD